MSDTQTQPISFSAMWTDKLGEEIKRRAVETLLDGYRMSIKSDDEYKALYEVWNQGIDSRLEAITERSSCEIRTGNGFEPVTAYFCIHPEELHVLVRRLMESGDEVAEDLASSICSTLGIELI